MGIRRTANTIVFADDLKYILAPRHRSPTKASLQVHLKVLVPVFEHKPPLKHSLHELAAVKSKTALLRLFAKGDTFIALPSVNINIGLELF